MLVAIALLTSYHRILNYFAMVFEKAICDLKFLLMKRRKENSIHMHPTIFATELNW